MRTNLDKAEQQLLGYAHAKRGFDLISLVEAMALKKNEWETIKEDYGLSYLNEKEIKEIDNHFKEEQS